MSKYQVLARKYRPQTFKEVVGQNPIVTTLKNAIRHDRLAHAYLFCGSRGTGKTTLARVFAKALNCQSPDENLEPCNQCSSCREITSGHSMDVLEIDGASHRGIDDIRQINENVGYATSNGKYKIYIIDEVHMLTKEAFNALLKTLEEPPPKVKFFFATTEPHKILPTILSRCQRFNLNRISSENIATKLRSIAEELKVPIQEDALRLLANRADGGLRDAESLLDQIISFYDGEITVETISNVLGIMPKDQLFELDRAGKDGNAAFAFELAYTIFSQGKDIAHFVENLTEHFRNILMVKLSGKEAPYLSLSEQEKEKYESSAKLYTQEQCLSILDFLVEAQEQIRFVPSIRIHLEALLVRIIRIHQRIPIDFLVKRLVELEEKLGKTPSMLAVPPPAVIEQSKLIPIPKPQTASITVDPTPTPADLGIRTKKTEEVKTQSQPAIQKAKEEVVSVTVETKSTPQPITQKAREEVKAPLHSPIQNVKYDTLLQFAAIELEGTIQKKQPGK